MDPQTRAMLDAENRELKALAELDYARAEVARLGRLVASLTEDASANAAKAREAQTEVARLRAYIHHIGRVLGLRPAHPTVRLDEDAVLDRALAAAPAPTECPSCGLIVGPADDVWRQCQCAPTEDDRPTDAEFDQLRADAASCRGPAPTETNDREAKA